MAVTDLVKNTARLVKVVWVSRKVGDSDFRPFNSVMSLKISAEFIALEAVNDLVDAGHSSSSKLSRSIKPDGPTSEGPRVQMHIVALDYYKYINKGIKGTRGGRTIGGFVFKTDIPSRQMVSSIAQWLKKSNRVSVQQVKRYHIRKSAKKQSKLSTMHTAYMIARSIKQKGVKPNYFFDMAVARNKNIVQERLRQAFAEDLINSLEKF